MDSNAQSTAWAVQGLEATGVDAVGLHRHGARSPLAYLRSLIGANGSVAYARGQSQTPVWVTGEALMALQGRPLPLAPVPRPVSARSARRAPTRHTGDRRRGAGRPAAHPSRTRAARKPRPPGTSGTSGAPMSPDLERRVLRLAAGAGVAAAALLAPVGVG
jgi:hypothetical protein